MIIYSTITITFTIIIPSKIDVIPLAVCVDQNPGSSLLNQCMLVLGI
jgi:hypothetical protein